jgi:hypothetical protein
MKLGFKFWVYAILLTSSIAGFLLTLYTRLVGQYELSIKLMILGIVAFAILLLYVWILKA